VKKSQRHVDSRAASSSQFFLREHGEGNIKFPFASSLVHRTLCSLQSRPPERAMAISSSVSSSSRLPLSSPQLPLPLLFPVFDRQTSALAHQDFTPRGAAPRTPPRALSLPQERVDKSKTPSTTTRISTFWPSEAATTKAMRPLNSTPQLRLPRLAPKPQQQRQRQQRQRPTTPRSPACAGPRTSTAASSPPSGPWGAPPRPRPRP